ncbi:MAG TPA: RNA-binding cell elongation regulator Jag/EloR [Spirochaetia bacterium]|nr:RNA-binding cell elongation regulator Jag/EloR [Spirochaetia bacterium]
MVKEFEGKTEKEAIDNAVAELGLERDEFDVEIVETQKSGFLNLQKKVLIRVHIPDERQFTMTTAGDMDPENDFEHAICDFLKNITEKMGFPADPRVMYRESAKIGVRLDSEHSGMIIGRKGKNLDAIQLLVNVVAGRLTDNEFRVIIDSENYRMRREESLIRLAQQVGDQVKRTKSSRLLDPMNPFERRLIHTTLSNIEGIDTKSEGDGLYKQVRVFYKGYDR